MLSMSNLISKVIFLSVRNVKNEIRIVLKIMSKIILK